MMFYSQKANIFVCLQMCVRSCQATVMNYCNVRPVSEVHVPKADSHSTMKLGNGSAGHRIILNLTQFRML